jgi:hypothetical protein
MRNRYRCDILNAWIATRLDTPAIPSIGAHSDHVKLLMTKLPLILGGTLLGGYAPRLRTIHLSGVFISFPAFRRLLLSTSDLDNLKLHYIPNNAYFSPELLVTSLSSLTRLTELSLRLSFNFSPRSKEQIPTSSSAYHPLFSQLC